MTNPDEFGVMDGLSFLPVATAASRWGHGWLTGKMCFVAGTKVISVNENGEETLRNIEDIAIGDHVKTCHHITGEAGVGMVSQTFVTKPTRLHHIKYVALSALMLFGATDAQSSQELLTTGEHPFAVMCEANPGFIWQPARNLQPGDVLKLSNGESAVVIDNAIENAKVGEHFTTYNFEVAGWHTYFVAPKNSPPGTPGVWVHNTCTPHEAAKARHTEWAADMDQINDTMARLGMRALKQSGGDFAKAEAILAKYGGMMNRRFADVGSTKRAVREAAVWNDSGFLNQGRGTRAPSFNLDGSPVKGTSRLDLAIVSTALPGKPIVSGIDISLSYTKEFKLTQYKRAFGNIPMADVRYSRNLFDPSAPMKNYIHWH